jgi:6-pyruvoyltetrahydropterin/6-carboxytetrahydropterin synthase
MPDTQTHQPQVRTGTVTAARRMRFSASHRLHSEDLDAEANRRVYGKCNNPSGHGHDYEIEVEIEDGPGANAALEAALNGSFEESVDHKHLNLDVEWLAEVIPTAELLAIRFWDYLEQELNPCRLKRLRLYEGPRNWVELPIPSRD